MQAIFYGVAFLEDVLKRIKEKKDVKFITAFKDLLFTTLAFPVSTVSYKDVCVIEYMCTYGRILLLGSKAVWEPLL